MDDRQIAEFVMENVPRHKHFTLATADHEGKPWAVYLQLNYDEQFNIFWVSRRHTDHSTHIESNPFVALCIASESDRVGDFGLYIRAEAKAVEDETEIERLLNIRSKRNGRLYENVQEYIGDSPARLYIAEPKEAWVNDDSHVKKMVDLDRLRQAVSNNTNDSNGS